MSVQGVVGAPVGLTIEPKIQTMFNFTGDTLVEGDCVALDVFGESAGASYSAAYGSPTHPLSRVVDITTSSGSGAFIPFLQNMGQAMVYIGKESLIAGAKGNFMVQGRPAKVKTLATTAELAIFTPNPMLYGWPTTANLTDKQVEPVAGANERILFWADSVGTADVVTLLSGIWLGDIGIGWGRHHT